MTSLGRLHHARPTFRPGRIFCPVFDSRNHYNSSANMYKMWNARSRSDLGLDRISFASACWLRVCLWTGIGIGVGKEETCESACVEMAIPTGTNTWEFLRGCHKTLVGSSESAKKYLTNTPPALGEATCTQMEVSGRGTNVMRFCVSQSICDPAPACTDVVCNIGLKPKDGGGLTGLADSPCTVATTFSCVKCASFDGKGKCSSGDKADPNAKGNWCSKVAGKYSGHDYVERGPTMLLPTEQTAPFCMDSISSNTTAYFAPIYGANVTRSKRSVTQMYAGATCFCNTDGCNSAPTVVGASVTLMLLLSALPFCC